ncbi:MULTISPECIES: hypothetical protein [unclassified Desulfovibrio]|uniref:hypothetical protein n=1 Tax=unclassified Desulfovibrio TaxID=2593640 RepID=UPI000F5F0B53|nr:MULTISPECIES: hypothetical protein [unclassified Desulfovibrio]RRD71708.1 hypothetical protein EII24_02080 [Desulfovibrio sp. OH1209_COT-279]RRD87921.1 hypothetical protein EII23_02080 [Desulfovibrio sp. OH1186_COT-070]
MGEWYAIEAEGASLRFVAGEGALCAGTGGCPPEGHEVAGRMGDPALLHCVVWRCRTGPGGLFVVYDREGELFAAVARSNLAYAAGLAHFGALTSHARYGADVFEEFADADD